MARKKSAMVIVKDWKTWFHPLCESISGQTRNGPLYENLNTPLLQLDQIGSQEFVRNYWRILHRCLISCHRMDFSDKVDISDLTWEQKEKVLRYLFARMNKTTKVSSRPSPPQTQPSTQPAISNGPDESIPRLMDKEAW